MGGRVHAGPCVVDQGRDASGSWLLTEALPGESAVCEHWKRRFDKAVREIGEGLRAFHDSPPVDVCPYSPKWPIRDGSAATDLFVKDCQCSEQFLELSVPAHAGSKSMTPTWSAAGVETPPRQLTPVSQLAVVTNDLVMTC